MVKLNSQIQWETLDAQRALKGPELEPAIYHCTPEFSEKNIVYSHNQVPQDLAHKGN